MKKNYKVPLAKIAEDFRLEVIVCPENFESFRSYPPRSIAPVLRLRAFMRFLNRSGFN